MKPSVLVIAGYGINSDIELCHAFELAGAEAHRVHFSDLATGAARIADHQIIAFPGGFSFGDHIASGRVLAVKTRERLGDGLREAVARGALVIGICNGFQVLTKLGLLPATQGLDGGWEQEATLTFNDSGRFENRWCPLVADTASPCLWTRGLESFELPVRHGEGKWVHRDAAVRARLLDNHLACLRYGGSSFPENPNGSQDDIAGVCDPTGRLFGLMPHPEVFVRGTQHPRWARGEFDPASEGTGLRIFRNAVEALQ